MFIAMNNFSVTGGKESDFEETWKGRSSYLQGVPGFVHFALLRGDQAGEYISHSTWVDREAFLAWTKSESFVAGHRQAGSLMGVLKGPPVVRTYESVIDEPAGQRAPA
ncbi:MAG: antibiotic biosynthesis monooxygenase [Dehalococcoidia bacterium]|nr:antibiotic biosynthesis monooxygenase [Dehalococcoidia bacterium]